MQCGGLELWPCPAWPWPGAAPLAAVAAVAASAAAPPAASAAAVCAGAAGADPRASWASQGRATPLPPPNRPPAVAPAVRQRMSSPSRRARWRRRTRCGTLPPRSRGRGGRRRSHASSSPSSGRPPRSISPPRPRCEAPRLGCRCSRCGPGGPGASPPTSPSCPCALSTRDPAAPGRRLPDCKPPKPGCSMMHKSSPRRVSASRRPSARTRRKRPRAQREGKASRRSYNGGPTTGVYRLQNSSALSRPGGTCLARRPGWAWPGGKGSAERSPSP
mmetsp:Transcript_109480/g.315262  ORF Transcript_109480/g.315262 Transcript_109480/m.315262 type:complete len:274 (+) Transcript_109480:1002-1823(+)